MTANPLPKMADADVAAADTTIAQPFEILQNWSNFAGTERRIIDSVRGAIQHASEDMRVETHRLTDAFQSLAIKSGAQSNRVNDLSQVANTIPFDGKSLEINEITALFNSILGDIVAKIVYLSRHAMSTVYALDGASENLLRVEECVGKVEQINRRTNILAINARIEAVRAGESGKAFAVVAEEIRELSRSTAELSHIIKQNMTAVTDSIRRGHEALRVVATVDMSDNILAKDKLDQIVDALLARNALLGSIVGDAGADAQDISVQINQVVSRLQFQDRVSQRLEQVCDTLAVLGDAVIELRQEGEAYLHCDHMAESPVDIAWLKELAARFKLSDMRADFVARVIEGQNPDATPSTQSDDIGTIELF